MSLRTLSDEECMKWMKTRRNTFAGYCFINAIIGIDYSIMLATLYLYLKNIIKTDRPELFYGLILAFYWLSALILGTIFEKLFDMLRKMRIYSMTVLFTLIISNVLYALHFHILFPLVSRVLGGGCEPFQRMITTEIKRVYSRKERSACIWWINSAFCAGLIVGPTIILLVENINIQLKIPLLTIHIIQLNGANLILTILSLFVLILNLFLIDDCSNVQDLALHLQKAWQLQLNKKKYPTRNLAEQETVFNPTSNFILPNKVILKVLLANTRTLLLVISTVVFDFNLYAIHVLMPLMILNLLKWHLTALTYVFLFSGLVYLFAMTLTSKTHVSDWSMYVLTIVGIVSQIAALVVVIALQITERDSDNDTCLVLLFIILSVFAWSNQKVLLQQMLKRLVLQSGENLVDILSNTLFKSSIVAASVSAAILFPYTKWFCTALICCAFVLFVCFIALQDELSNLRRIEVNRKRPVLTKYQSIDDASSIN